MKESVENDRTNLFAHPVTFLVTHLVMPLLATGATAYIYWLSCDAIEGLLAAKAIAALIASAAFPLLALVALLVRPRRMNAWLMFAWAIAGASFLYLAVPVLFEMSTKVDGWIIGSTPNFAIFAGIMPLIFAGLARVATAKWRVTGGNDLGLSVLCLVIGHAIGYAVNTISFRCWRFFNDLKLSELAQSIIAHLLVIGAIALTGVFFIGLLRIMHKGFNVMRNCLPDDFSRFFGAVLFGLALPIGGLILNQSIPFPADFSNPWAWGLTVFTALTLFIPARPRPLGLAALFLKFAALPFVLYFFILFLPFLPLAIPAILAIGVGFLILAPTLLFRYWTQDAARSWRILRERYTRRALFLTAIAGALVLPTGFCIDVEMERHDVKAILAWHTQEDFDKPPAPMPVSQKRAEKIMRGINDYTFGAEIPFLSAWRTWRVYDGMYMADKLRNELNRRILGKTINDERDMEEQFRTRFSSAIFGVNSARRSPNRGAGEPWRGRPIRTTVFTTDVRQANTSADEALYVVTIKPTADVENREFSADLSLPPGAWIEGMRLKMTNGVWKTARPSERKAAEWVYNKITEQRLDPSIVTLDSPTNGRIKLFPVGKDGREVELTVRLPSLAYSPFVMHMAVGTRVEHIANPAYPHIDGASIPQMFTANDAAVTVMNDAWIAAHEGEMAPSVASAEIEWLDIDDPELMRKLRRRLRECAKGMPANGLGILPNFKFVPRDVIDAEPIDITKTNILSRADLTVLYRELPGIESLGDKPVDGWLALEAEDGRKVAIPWRRTDGGAIAFERLKGAREIDGPWAVGAKAWELENQGFLKPYLDVRRELLELTRKTGTLTTKSAYIVVETAAQEKGLMQKELEALHGDKSLDFDESTTNKGDAPGFLILLASIAAATLFLRHHRGSKVALMNKRP